MKTVLITGAAGFIGSHLAEALLQRGDAVIGIDNFNDYYDPRVKRLNIHETLLHERFKLHELDILDEPALRWVFGDNAIDTVVHLAARAGVRPSLQDPNLYHRVNVIGSQHVLDACRDYKVPHLVFASSSSVYGGNTSVPFREKDPVDKPLSPYGASKRMNELQSYVYHQLYGLHVSMMRFFTVYGPRQRPDMAIHKFIDLVLNDKPIPFFGDGTTRRDYTYIDDIIDGLLKAVDKPYPYEIFNLGEHHTTSLSELVELVEKHTGKRATLEPLPEQPGDVRITHADINHAQALLGYAPKWTMDEGMAASVAWVRAQREAEGTP